MVELETVTRMKEPKAEKEKALEKKKKPSNKGGLKASKHGTPSKGLDSSVLMTDNVEELKLVVFK